MPTKTLSELADEYETNIPVLEKILKELRDRYEQEPYKAYLQRDITTVEDMLCELKVNIYEMRHYYDDSNTASKK